MSHSTGLPSRSVTPSGSAPYSNWLNAASGVRGPEENDVAQPKPREQSRHETMQQYMRAYANGEVVRERGNKQRTPLHTNESPDIEMAEPHQQNPTTAQEPQQHPPPFTLTQEQEASYTFFLREAHQRRLQRHNLATRDRIWDESLSRTRARLEAVNAERASLETKVVEMERERERYKVLNAVGVDEETDQREERRWEEWLRVQRGIEVKRPGVGDGEEMEEGGVDI